MTTVRNLPIPVADPEHEVAVRKLLAAAPPFTEDQRNTIRAAIRSARDLAGAR
jgi:hypothetical protein